MEYVSVIETNFLLGLMSNFCCDVGSFVYTWLICSRFFVPYHIGLPARTFRGGFLRSALRSRNRFNFLHTLYFKSICNKNWPISCKMRFWWRHQSRGFIIREIISLIKLTVGTLSTKPVLRSILFLGLSVVHRNQPCQLTTRDVRTVIRFRIYLR